MYKQNPPLKSSRLKLIFAGTADFGLPALNALAKAHDIIAVYTQPDRPAGRGQKLTVSPIKKWAQDNNVAVFQPSTFKDERSVEQLKDLAPHLIIVIAYGLILPKRVLDIPRFGCINVHASLLPKWRGASPIQQVILQGDPVTGITIMQMDAKMDAGAILATTSIPLAPEETAGSLHAKLQDLAPPLLLTTLNQLMSNTLEPKPQPHEIATYCKKILKDDGKIDWAKPAFVLERMIRAYYPWPCAFTFYSGSSKQDPLRVRVIKASVVKAPREKPGTILAVENTKIIVATGDQALCLEKLQLPGKKELTVAECLRGNAQLFTQGRVFS
ncbi:MAG: methionyl-tRNA formyltransferase [Legionellales bacterium RIFCSPHIGHO2_12_FULL_37_14]|nr:MAG: methionyl-tRNA formyltransferase [Legionellales bacterium RIFCSPHIGHO2_12_FULL_37_14]